MARRRRINKRKDWGLGLETFSEMGLGKCFMLDKDPIRMDSPTFPSTINKSWLEGITAAKLEADEILSDLHIFKVVSEAKTII